MTTITDQLAEALQCARCFIPDTARGTLPIVDSAIAAYDAAKSAPAASAAVSDGWMQRFEELLEDYAGSRAETAVWNVTQSVQPEGGIRMAGPRMKALMAHVALLPAAPPSPAEPVQVSELPPLPEPVDAYAIAAWGPKPDYYTVEQMHAYARAAIAALQQPIGWMPIETAPKSIAHPDGRIEGKYLLGFIPPVDDDYVSPQSCQSVIWWEPLVDGGVWYSDASIAVKPTYWKPLGDDPIDLNRCTLPPDGWEFSRAKGHAGPLRGDAYWAAEGAAMSGELKPCPCCGGDAHLTSCETAAGDYVGRARCSECGVSVIASHLGLAIEAWNRRAQPICPHIVSSDEGTSHCALAEAQQPSTDEDVLRLTKMACRIEEAIADRDHVQFPQEFEDSLRRVLARGHQPSAQEPIGWLSVGKDGHLIKANPRPLRHLPCGDYQLYTAPTLRPVSDEDVEAARAVYLRIAGEGWEVCFVCHGNPDNQYCPTCENEGRLWKKGANDPMRAALESFRARLMGGS